MQRHLLLDKKQGKVYNKNICHGHINKMAGGTLVNVFNNDGFRTARNMRRTESNLAKASRRLSSGYRVNSAADDAAGLAVSEKLRAIDRGLRQGLRNVTDGINYLDTVDGCAQEINNMLHRMKELAVEAANGTYDELDRKALDLEYRQLVSEIGQISDSAEFNGLPLFERHYSEYEKDCGAVVHDNGVVIDGSNSRLVIGYTKDGNSSECVVDIPAGKYSVTELTDVIDTALWDMEPSLIIGSDDSSRLTMQCEGGKLDYISGSGSSLFYDTVIGSTDGYLLGVTTFYDDTTAAFRVVPGKNDVIEFRLGNDDTKYSIQLEQGLYTRPQLVDRMNEKLRNAALPCEVEAVLDNNAEGKKIIGLKSEQTITGLSGNFLMIDGGTKPIHSPIYDICNYSTLVNSEAVLAGTKNLTNGVEIVRGRNDYFVLDAGWYNSDGTAVRQKLRIDLLDSDENVKVYANSDQIADRIREQLAAYNCPITLETPGGALRFSTLQYGSECRIKLDKSDVPSEYMVYDLFDASTLVRVAPGKEQSAYSAANLKCKKTIAASIIIPENHNSLSFKIYTDPNGSLTDTTIKLEIPTGTYTQASLRSTLNSLLWTDYPEFKDKLFFDVGSNLSLAANGNKGWEITKIEALNDTAYSRLVYGTDYYNNIDSSHSTGSEQPLVQWGNTNPSTGGPNVVAAAGKTVQAVTYEKYTPSSSAQRQGALLSYYKGTVSISEGKTIDHGEKEGESGNPIYMEFIPAQLKLSSALTQFTAAGSSLRDIDLSFDLTDISGTTNSYSIVIPKGSTEAQAIQLINNTLGDKVTASKDGSSLVLTSVEKGEGAKFGNVSGKMTDYAVKNSLANRSDAHTEGDMVYVPATLSLTYAGSNLPLTVNASNDRFKFTAGGHSYDLRLTNKDYQTLSQLADEINARISEADGGSPATKISVNGSALVFTGPEKESGSITVDPTSTLDITRRRNVTPIASSPYYNPATGNAEEPATITATGADSHFPMTVDSTNNTITMDYTETDPSSPSGKRTQALTIVIPDGTYSSGSQLAGALNSVIAADPSLNGKITAGYSSSGSKKGLTFTTVNGGDGYSLTNLGGTANIQSYKTVNSSSGGTSVPTENKIKYPAYIRNSAFSSLFGGEGVEINDTNDFVSLKVNGADYKFRLTHGVYSGSSGSTSLMAQLNAGLAAAGVNAEYSGSTLTITTDAVGTGASISLNADNTSPYFKRAVSCGSPVSTSRTSAPCYIIGQANISNVEIKSWYNEMTFDYSDNGLTQTINLSVPEGNYTAASLAAEIQSQIDAQIGTGQLTVGSSGGHLSITAAKVGNTQKMQNFGGRLFDKVFQNPKYSGVSPHSETVGTSTGSAVSYIIGRNTMEPETPEEFESGKSVIIYSGLNDQLIFDFTYQGNVYKVELEIPAGAYDPPEIAEAVQKAGRESMSRMSDVNGKPLPADCFNASIGLGAIGVVDDLNVAIPSYDKLILSYSAPNNGTIKRADAIIDGVRGNAAYRLFYSATQSPRPTRVIGNADLSDGVTIIEGQNDTFSIDIDGESFSVTVPAGIYTCEGVSEVLNSRLEAAGCMVRTIENKGHLMIYTTENGAYDIGKITGSAADDLFYGADKRDDDEEIGIHYGRRTDSYIWYSKTRLDEHLMRINTTGVTTIERALKAIDRLDNANKYLLGWRTLVGAMHNRSEHTYAANSNTIENLESSESAIRDADMPSEVAEAARQRLVMQAQEYILANQKSNQQSVLNILA